jgi:hypothetical protein
VSIADKLTYLNDTKTAIKTAIEAKGVSMSNADTFRSYANKVSAIESGGNYTDTVIKISKVITSDEDFTLTLVLKKLNGTYLKVLWGDNEETIITDNGVATLNHVYHLSRDYLNYSSMTIILQSDGDYYLGDGEQTPTISPDSTIRNMTIVLSNRISILNKACLPDDLYVDLIIPEGLTEIEGQIAFDTKMTYLLLPKSLVRLGDFALFVIVGLEKLYLQENLQYIGRSALGYIYDLKEIQVSENNNFFKVTDGVLFTKDGTELIMRPAAFSGATAAYVIPNTVTKIRENALVFRAEKLETIIIPNSVLTIEGGAIGKWAESGSYTRTIYVQGRSEKPSGWANNWLGSSQGVNVVWNA